MYHPQKNKAVTIIGLLCVIAGAMVITSRLLNTPLLETMAPPYLYVKFNSALCFIFLGAALILTQFESIKYNKLFFLALALPLTLIAVLSLSEYIFHFNAGIDQLFIIDRLATPNKYPFPGRMVPQIAVAFGLCGLALLGFTVKNNLIHNLSQYALHLVTAISGVAMISYFYSYPFSYSLQYKNPIVLLMISLLFFTSIIASLLHPSLGVTRLFSGSLVGNKMARRLFGLMAFVIVVFGSLREQSLGFKLFAFDTNFSMLIFCLLLMSLAIIWHTANWLNRIDAKRYEAEEEIKVMNEELEERVRERSSELSDLLKKFKESESRFRAAFEFSAIGMALVSLDGKWLKVNKRLCEMVGYSEQELLSMTFMDITHPDDLAESIKAKEKSIASENNAFRLEKRYLRKNGTSVWVCVNMATLTDGNGKPLYIVSQVEDITERKTVEDQLLKSEEKYRSLIEHASDAIYVLDFKGNFTDANESMCKMTGYPKEELLRLNIEQVIDPEQLKTDPVAHGPRDPYEAIIRERRLVRKDGQVFDVEIHVKMFPDDKVLVIARDITDRKRMESELRDAELKFRTMAERSMVGVYISQKEKFIYVNPRFAEIFGYEPHELINTQESAIDMIISKDDQAKVRGSVQARYKGEADNAHYEVRGTKKDGTYNYVEFYGNRVTIDGEPSIIGTMLDITERKIVEELVLREKTLSDTIINSLPEVFYLRNDKGEFLRWNKNFEKITGYSSEEIKKLNSKDQLAEEDRGKVKGAVEKMFKEGHATVEARVITKDGAKIPFLITITPLIYENQQCVLGIAIDISARLKAEEELRSSEQKYKLLFDSNPQPLWMIAKDDLSIIAVNEAAANLYGYAKDELLKMNAAILRPREDRDQQMEIFRKDISDSNEIRVNRHIKKDGSIIFVHIISHDIIFEGRSVRLSLTTDVTEKLKAEEELQKSEANLKAIMDTTDTAYALLDKQLKIIAYNHMAVKFVSSQYNHILAKGDVLTDYFPKERLPEFIKYADDVSKGKNISYETNYPQADGSVLWYDVKLFPIINEKQEIFGLMMSLSDISERKNAEESLKAAYNLIQDHISSIKDMAWKQSHLIRSPLANLKGLAAMLKDDPADTDVLDHIQNELDRMDAIIIEMAEDASNHDT